MNIKTKPQKRTTSAHDIYNENTIGINFDLQSLDLFCMYVVSENNYIRSSHIANTKKLFDRIDVSKYGNDREKLLRIEFIKRGLEGKVVRKIKNKQLLLKYINGGFNDKDLIPINVLKELSSEEIDWINEVISESAKFSFMYDYVDQVQDICARFKAEDYSRRGDIVQEFETVIDNLKKEFRRVKNESVSEMEFSLANGIFEECITDIYSREINPSRRLITGMQGFNEIVGGGLESGRVYMLFGMAGAGKSLTLLNIAYQIKKYNKNYVCKDKTKKPCIAFLTMENSVHETITRLFSLIAGDRMNTYDSADQVIEKLRVDGELVLNDDSPIDIIVKYKPNMSVDTTYLYTFCDDLDDRGYEVILMMQDHIKRIRPQFPRHDIRLDLGEVVNDFKVFVNEKDIPLLSDSHLNRDGARIIDSAMSANKMDITRLLGRSNVGESMLMIDNTDCGIILNKEYDKYGNEWMIFFRQKMRDFCTKRDYIAQPFVKGSTIRLVEDLNDPIPSFRESLYEPATLKNDPKTNNDYCGNIKVIDDDDSIFNTGAAPQPVVLSQMNYEIIGTPSTPVYNNFQQMMQPIQSEIPFDESGGFFGAPMVPPIINPLQIRDILIFH